MIIELSFSSDPGASASIAEELMVFSDEKCPGGRKRPPPHHDAFNRKKRLKREVKYPRGNIHSKKEGGNFGQILI